MNLSATIWLLAGGPGSGCRGENCGRKKISNEDLDNFIRHWRYPMGRTSTRGFGDPSNETREQAIQFLRETLPGGALEHLHPGNVTVYRGFDKHKVSKMGVSSFSRWKWWAKGYGKKVRQLKLTRNTPALDISRTGRHLGSEIIVQEGNK